MGVATTLVHNYLIGGNRKRRYAAETYASDLLGLRLHVGGGGGLAPLREEA